MKLVYRTFPGSLSDCHIGRVKCLFVFLLLGLLWVGAARGVDLHVNSGHPDANDANDGQSASFPLLTIKGAINQAKSFLNNGTEVKIVVAAGAYREKLSYTASGLATNAPLAIEGDPRGGTRILGTIATGFEPGTWQAVGGKPNIYEHAWPYEYGLHEGLWANSLARVPEGPAFRREMLFVGETMLRPRALELVDWVDADGAGGAPGALVYQGIAPGGLDVLDADWTFAVADNDASPAHLRNRVFMRAPAGVDLGALGGIEVSRDANPELLFFKDKHHLTLRHLRFERAGTWFTSSAVTFNNCDHATVEDCSISFNNGQGFNSNTTSDRLTMRRCRLNHNGLKGAGRGFSNALIVDTEFNHNCWLAALGNFLDFDTAGIKIGAFSENVLLKRCIAFGNLDYGFWTDVGCKRTRYEQCFAYRNARAGIFLEYSHDDFSQGDDSVFRSVSAYNDVGIKFSNARRPWANECLTLNNTTAEFRHPFVTGRNPQTAADYVSMTVTNCRMYNQLGSQLVVAGESFHQPEPLSAMVMDGNRYFSSSPGSAFEAAGFPPASFPDWKAYMTGRGAVVDATTPSTVTTIADFATDPLHLYPGSELGALAEQWDVAVPYEYIWTNRGIFSVSGDIGAPARPGRGAQDAGAYVVVGGGSGLGGTNDSIHLFSETFVGDFDVVARVVEVENTGVGARAGLMLRETLSGGSKYAAIMVTAGGDVVFSSRAMADQIPAEVVRPGASAPRWVRLSRVGDLLTGYISDDFIAWQSVGTASLTLPAQARLGLFATAGDDQALCTVLFDGVQTGFEPNRIAEYRMGSDAPSAGGTNVVAGSLVYSGDGIGLFDKTLPADPTPGGTQPFLQGYLSAGSVSFTMSPALGVEVSYGNLSFEMQVQGDNRWVELTSSATGAKVLWTLRGAVTDGNPVPADADLGGSFLPVSVDISAYPELQNATDPIVFTFTYRGKPTEAEKKNWRLDNLRLEGVVQTPPPPPLFTDDYEGDLGRWTVTDNVTTDAVAQSPNDQGGGHTRGARFQDDADTDSRADAAIDAPSDATIHVQFDYRHTGSVKKPGLQIRGGDTTGLNLHLVSGTGPLEYNGAGTWRKLNTALAADTWYRLTLTLTPEDSAEDRFDLRIQSLDAADSLLDVTHTGLDFQNDLGSFDQIRFHYNVPKTEIGGEYHVDNLLVTADPTALRFDVDGDRDGLDDRWETMFFGNLTTATRLGDADNDGATDYEEFRAGTNPTNAASLFALTSLTAPAGSAAILRWNSIAGRYYRVETTGTLPANWTNISGNLPANPPVNSFTNPSTGDRRRMFFRVILDR